MNARPRNPEPVAGQPRPRHVKHGWIDRLPTITYTTASVIILLTIAATGH